MHLATLSGRRFRIWWAVLLTATAFLLWFIPAVLRAGQPAPAHAELVVLSPCAADTAMGPNYGSREPVSYCRR
ncbi:MAG: hypothetical protein U0Q20_07115 [Mycobacterium sp.]